MNLKCLIIDDEEPTIQHLIKYINKVPYLKLQNYFLDPTDALEYLKTNTIDVIFIDIEMPNSDLDGFDFIKLVGKTQKYILTTSHPKYALIGFDYSAVDFLHKPYSYDRFLEAVKKVKDLVSITNGKEKLNDTDTIIIKGDNAYNKIILNDILYVSSEKNYINIHTPNEKIKALFTLSSIEQQLPFHSFMRINKSYLVNLDKIKNFNNDFVIIKIGMSEKNIPIGDTYKKIFLNYFENKILKSS